MGLAARPPRPQPQEEGTCRPAVSCATALASLRKRPGNRQILGLGLRTRGQTKYPRFLWCRGEGRVGEGGEGKAEEGVALAV